MSIFNNKIQLGPQKQLFRQSRTQWVLYSYLVNHNSAMQRATQNKDQHIITTLLFITVQTALQCLDSCSVFMIGVYVVGYYSDLETSLVNKQFRIRLTVSCPAVTKGRINISFISPISDTIGPNHCTKLQFVGSQQFC